jgi:hypothetical protein
VSKRARAVADFSRNARPISNGRGGRNEPEWVAELKRNQWPNWAGIRSFFLGGKSGVEFLPAGKIVF